MYYIDDSNYQVHNKKGEIIYFKKIIMTTPLNLQEKNRLP